MATLTYLRCFLASEADRDDLQDELKELMELAMVQPGCTWMELGRDVWDDRKHMLLAEWADDAAADAFESQEAFQGFMRHWPDERWAEPLELRRLKD